MRSRKLFCLIWIPLLVCLYVQPLHAQQIGSFSASDGCEQALTAADARHIARVLLGDAADPELLFPGSDSGVSAIVNDGAIPYCISADSGMIDVWVYGLYTPRADGASYYRLCRTEKPHKAQLDAAQKKAEALLAEMALGQWTLSRCEAEAVSCGNDEGYAVTVSAMQLDAGSTAIFRFNADGVLLSFTAEL